VQDRWRAALSSLQQANGPGVLIGNSLVGWLKLPGAARRGECSRRDIAHRCAASVSRWRHVIPDAEVLDFQRAVAELWIDAPPIGRRNYSELREGVEGTDDLRIRNDALPRPTSVRRIGDVMMESSLASPDMANFTLLKKRVL
jgi:hypothetical protein